MPTEQEIATAAKAWNDTGKEVGRAIALMIARQWQEGNGSRFERLANDGIADRQAEYDAQNILAELREEEESIGDSDDVELRERQKDLPLLIMEMEALADWIDTQVTLVTCACDRAGGCWRRLPGLPGDMCEECSRADAHGTSCLDVHAPAVTS